VSYWVSEEQQGAMKNYAEIKEECHREKKLFEDPDFPAIDSSFTTTRGHSLQRSLPLEWKRPGVSSFKSMYLVRFL